MMRCLRPQESAGTLDKFPVISASVPTYDCVPKSTYTVPANCDAGALNSTQEAPVETCQKVRIKMELCHDARQNPAIKKLPPVGYQKIDDHTLES